MGSVAPLLFLLFTALPFVELWLLLQIGQELGAPATLGLIVATGLLGTALARWQGTAALARLRADLAQGHAPTGALLDGALVLVGSVLLITPGVITDVVGLLLLVPPVRALVARGVARWAQGRVKTVVRMHAPPGFDPRGFGATMSSPAMGGEVRHIEAEVRDAPKAPD